MDTKEARNEILNILYGEENVRTMDKNNPKLALIDCILEEYKLSEEKEPTYDKREGKIVNDGSLKKKLVADIVKVQHEYYSNEMEDDDHGRIYDMRYDIFDIIMKWPDVGDDNDGYDTLDFENFELINIQDDIFQINCGGDWQESHEVFVGINDKGYFQVISFKLCEDWKDGLKDEEIFNRLGLIIKNKNLEIK